MEKQVFAVNKKQLNKTEAFVTAVLRAFGGWGMRTLCSSFPPLRRFKKKKKKALSYWFLTDPGNQIKYSRLPIDQPVFTQPRSDAWFCGVTEAL